MLKFFDYLFFGVRKFYNENKDSGAGWPALAVITVTQTLNILTIYFLYELINETRVSLNKLVALAIYLLVLILNIIRYSKLDLDRIEEKWENKNNKQKTTIRAFVFVYVFLSFSIAVGLAIYNGNRANS